MGFFFGVVVAVVLMRGWGKRGVGTFVDFFYYLLMVFFEREIRWGVRGGNGNGNGFSGGFLFGQEGN